MTHMIVSFIAAVVAAGCMFGLGWMAGAAWQRGGRLLEELLDEDQSDADTITAGIRALPRVPAHEPPSRALSAAGPAWEPSPAIVLIRGPWPVLRPLEATPIHDQLAAELERRATPPDPAIAGARRFLAGLDKWQADALAAVRNER
jgi:hypothetical protein